MCGEGWGWLIHVDEKLNKFKYKFARAGYMSLNDAKVTEKLRRSNDFINMNWKKMIFSFQKTTFTKEKG